MPDGSKLVAALSLGVLAFLLTPLVQAAVIAERGDTNFGYFLWVNVAVGVVVGWVAMGKRAGRGWSSAITNGVTGVFLLVLWGLFLQSINEMVRLAMRNSYDGPVEAIAAVFEIGAEWGLWLLNPPILIMMAVGAVVCGFLTEVAWRIWR